MDIRTIRNNIAPAQEQGRWYHFFVESDGTNYTLTTKDIATAAIDATDKTIVMPKKFQVVDYNINIHNDAGSDVWYQKRTRLYASDHKIGVEIPAVTSFDYLDVYVFGYFEA